jgi:NRAMP (natural resistance-associated macrophage protein)-like metal ion transporter
MQGAQPGDAMTAAPDLSPTPPSPRRRWTPASLFRRLGPGLVTGAADDDPSGIATYSQTGAQFGVNMLWTLLFTYPLMTAVQAICARIGRVTGRGLATNMAQVLPRPVVSFLVILLFIANTANIGADLAAMGAAAELLAGRWQAGFAVFFAMASLLLQIFIPYHRYVVFLKWMTLALFAYVGVVFTVQIDWAEVLRGTLLPKITWSREAILIVVAVFGTTISPYLFFWQAAQEVEDATLKGSSTDLLSTPGEAPAELSRIHVDTIVGMAFSNLIAFFIMLTTAVTLHRAGITDISTSAEAAEALRPIAGRFAFLLFSLGIIGTGLLALPVLAGSAAYAIGELRGWPTGLEYKPANARSFYAVITLGMGVGLAIIFLPIDPIRALVWSAVLNGIIAVPLMAATMRVAASRRQLGPFTAPRWQLALGWTATAAMAAAALALLIL